MLPLVRRRPSGVLGRQRRRWLGGELVSAGTRLAAVLADHDGAAARGVFRALDRYDATTGPIPVVPAQGPPRAPAVREGTARIGARLVENEWLVVITDERPRLHHANLSEDQLNALMDVGVLEADAEHPAALRMSCGGFPALAAKPGPLDVRSTRRCAGCCTALGYPVGVGSPRVDEGCRVALDAREEALR